MFFKVLRVSGFQGGGWAGEMGEEGRGLMLKGSVGCWWCVFLVNIAIVLWAFQDLCRVSVGFVSCFVSYMQ